MNKNRVKKVILSFIAAGALFLALLFSAPLAKGAQNGIQLCLNSLIPSLFIFMALCSFFMETGIGYKMLSFLASPLSRLLHISHSGAAIFCFSLLGGFPVGAKLLADAVKRKEIDQNTAERMLAYCVNCGPAFLISAVSVPIFHNYTIGIIVYCSQVLSALAVAIITARNLKKKNVLPVSRQQDSGAVSFQFIHAVESTIRSMALICALVVIFSAINYVLDDIEIMQKLASGFSLFMTDKMAISLLTGILEVTNGCNALAASQSLIVLIIITGFGGLCVQLQIKAVTANMRMTYFYLYRPLYIACSLFFSMILIRFFGGTAAVFNYQQPIVQKPFLVSPAFSILLIILSVFLLLSVRKSDIINKTLTDGKNE